MDLSEEQAVHYSKFAAGDAFITRQAIRRDTFTSVADLEAAISTYIGAWNDCAAPFTWTKDADAILAKAIPPTRRTATRR